MCEAGSNQSHRPDTSPLMGEAGRGWGRGRDTAANSLQLLIDGGRCVWPTPLPTSPTWGEVPFGASGKIQPNLSNQSYSTVAAAGFTPVSETEYGEVIAEIRL